ncbi:MAG: hypothetical protein ACI9HK_004643, partial [Pirellulaceae bacterium]
NCNHLEHISNVGERFSANLQSTIVPFLAVRETVPCGVSRPADSTTGLRIASIRLCKPRTIAAQRRQGRLFTSQFQFPPSCSAAFLHFNTHQSLFFIPLLATAAMVCCQVERERRVLSVELDVELESPFTALLHYRSSLK